jgi:hypothetical protein
MTSREQEALKNKKKCLEALMQEPCLEPEKYSEGIAELCKPGAKNVDHNQFKKLVTNQYTIDELVSCLIRSSNGRILSSLSAGLCQALPTVSIN